MLLLLLLLLLLLVVVVVVVVVVIVVVVFDLFLSVFVKSYLKYDKLIIDGETFEYDETSEDIVQVRTER